jgi:NTP pyrophosphatase (non-canonical NTP hydrolase)
MNWLRAFSAAAAQTDSLIDHPEHSALLGAGLVGEAGSILAELKKEERERNAYPAYRRRMLEEFGDFLWYYVRLLDLYVPEFLDELQEPSRLVTRAPAEKRVRDFLEFAGVVGEIAVALGLDPVTKDDLRGHLERAWNLLEKLALENRISLAVAAEENIRKIRSRWPLDRTAAGFFDGTFPEQEQIPRYMEVEFRETDRGNQKEVIVLCDGKEFGDKITDNIPEPDLYRYHDIFHFTHAAHLRWSPVIRKLLGRKRKSAPEVDEGEDGARAYLIEEAVSAVVFSRAKHLRFFDGINHVDFDLLKMTREFVGGYEVEIVPLWQWEEAILDGYRVFRQLRDNRGGRVIVDLERRLLDYTALP